MWIKDTSAGYGLVSRVFHWVMAVAIFLLFALGWWMVGLDYYSPYYNSAPDLHRSAGILLALALVARIAWRMINVRPDAGELTPFERGASRLAHTSFYVLLVVLVVSGYFISTPDGRPIDVFGWFSVPSLVQSKGLESVAGFVHEWVAYGVIGLAVIHSAAAIKHHFVDKGRSLTRMWSGPASQPPDR